MVHHLWYTRLMPTKNPRVQVVLEKSLYAALSLLAKEEGVSLSLKARDLIREALELIEDSGLETIVERRMKNKAPSIPHQELKRRLGIK